MKSVALKPRSSRERVLILVLGFSVVVAAYAMLRIQPLKTEMLVLEELLKQSQQDLKEAKPLRPGGQNHDKLQSKLDELKQQVKAAQNTLEGFENSFADLSQSDVVPVMRKQITRLASELQLRVLRINASSMDLTRLAETKVQNWQPAELSLLNRRLFDLEISGGFFQLKQFIAQLKQLPHAVVVTRFSVDRTEAGEPLHAKLTLAF